MPDAPIAVPLAASEGAPPGARAAWAGMEYNVALPAAATGGALGLFSGRAPAGSGPPRHVHDDADESFYVISGRIRFWMDGEAVTRGSGEAIFIPRGAEHAYRVHDEADAEIVTILTPGGFEGFFLDAAREGLRIPEDMARLGELAAAYRLRFTGPPLRADE